MNYKLLFLSVLLTSCACGVYQEREVYVEKTVMRPVKVLKKVKSHRVKPCEYVFCEPVIFTEDL